MVEWRYGQNHGSAVMDDEAAWKKATAEDASGRNGVSLLTAICQRVSRTRKRGLFSPIDLNGRHHAASLKDEIDLGTLFAAQVAEPPFLGAGPTPPQDETHPWLENGPSIGQHRA